MKSITTILFLSIVFSISLLAQTRVVCVGNSITAGYGTSNAATKAWPAQLASMLGSDYSVLNCGVSGTTMLKKGDSPYWNTTKLTDAKNYDPQVVIISLGVNDTKSQNWVYKSEFQTDYIAMINEFRANGKNPIIYVCYPAPYFGNTSQNTIIRDEMLPILKSISTTQGTLLVDFNSQMLPYSNLFPDGLHPNDQGAAIMAQIVHNSLTQSTVINSGSIYKVLSKASNKTLNVSNASMDLNANVDTWSDTQSDAQRWIVSSLGGDLYTLTNVASGKLLHIAGSGVAANSVNVDQTINTNNNTVRWKIVSQGNGYFTLQSAVNNVYVLNLPGTVTADGANVALYQSNATDAQSWSFHLEAPQDAAPTMAIADKMFTAWRAKYYDKNRTGNEVIAKEGFWGVAEMMEIVDDAYEVTGYSKYSTLFGNMYNLFITKEGTDWMWNAYNDDITWMVIACTRASLLTGNTVYQIKAKEQFDKMYARAIHEGSWLTWKQGTAGTNSCINGPAMVACCYLAQATGDKTYYDKAIAIYNWSKNKLFNPSTGKVNDNYNNGVVGDWSSTYNQGTYLGAAMMLYNYTQDPTYFLEAQRIAQFTKVTMWGSATMNGEDGPDLNGFKGIFMRYARRYVVDGNKTDYIPWLQLNAKVAYNNRNSENLIYTRWGTRATETIALPVDTAIKRIPAFAASTAVSLLMNCPFSTTQIKNAYNIIESEDFDYMKGVYVEACPEGTSNLNGVKNGFYTAYYNVDFGFKGAESAQIRLSSLSNIGTIEIRLGSPTGMLIGTATTSNTSSFATYTTINCPVTNIKGMQNIYLVYKGSGLICNINNFKFTEASTASETHGLLGSYFNGTSFTTSVLKRIDNSINFDWAEFSPAAQVNVNSFSIRWTGKIQPLYTETYTFYITADNGRRVWVNNQLLIDKWTNDVGVTYSGTIDLVAGQKYDVKVEYYDLSGNANIKLEWQSAQQTREVIPNSQLFLPDELPSAIAENKSTEDGLIIYPNPVKTQAVVNSGNLDAIQVSIFDIKGELLIQSKEKFTGTKTFEVSELPKGIYFIKVLSSNGVKRSQKFIK